MTYEQILAQQPHSTEGGNLDAARAFVSLLTSVIETRDVVRGLNDSQQRYLYKLRSRWIERAEGRDLRWNATGTRPGRPCLRGRSDGPRKHRRTLKADPSEETPLFQSLMQKYGTPTDPARQEDGDE